MRIFLSATILSLAALGACNGDPADNEPTASVAEDSDARPYPTIAVSGEPGDCSFAWDGEAVDIDAVQQRAMSMMERVVDRLGVENIVEEQLPGAVIEAASTDHYGCAAEALSAIQSAGFYELTLRASDTGEGERALIALTQSPPTLVMVPIDLSPMDLRWDGEPIDIETLRQRAGGAEPAAPDAPPLTIEAAPPSLSVRPEGAVTIARLQQILAAIGQSGTPAELSP